jgi:hypothetical protein
MLTSVNDSPFRKLNWHINDLTDLAAFRNTIYYICEIHEVPLNGVTEIQETLWRMYED